MHVSTIAELKKDLFERVQKNRLLIERNRTDDSDIRRCSTKISDQAGILLAGSNVDASVIPGMLDGREWDEHGVIDLECMSVIVDGGSRPYIVPVCDSVRPGGSNHWIMFLGLFISPKNITEDVQLEILTRYNKCMHETGILDF